MSHLYSRCFSSSLRNILLIFVLSDVLLHAQLAKEQATASIVGRDQHSRQWQNITADGQTNSYTELCSGICYKDDKGNWLDSSTAIEIQAKGHGTATKIPYKVILSPDVSSEGAIDMLTPGSQRMKSTLRGLAYFNATSGKSVWLDEPEKGGQGELVKSNEVAWINAFKKIKASVRYRVGLAQFEQDVILHAQLPTPEEMGIVGSEDKDSSHIYLETWTEFQQAPEPKVTRKILKYKPGKGSDDFKPEMVAQVDEKGHLYLTPKTKQENPYAEFVDDKLDFGDGMTMGKGRIYIEEKEGSNPDPIRIIVGKRWEVIQGRTFLIESVSYDAIRPLMKDLPTTKQAGLFPIKNPIVHGPCVPPLCEPAKEMQSSLLAKADTKEMQGLVLDYVTIYAGTNSNYTFKGDTTYFVTGSVWLKKQIILEGGAVLKYATNNQSAVLFCDGPFICKTTPYRPAIFTSMNDNTVGEIISGSTGNPNIYSIANYAAGAFLYFESDMGGGVNLSDVRFSYGFAGMFFGLETGFTLKNAQIMHCFYGVHLYQSDARFMNILINDVRYLIQGNSSGTFRGEHVTLENISCLAESLNIYTILFTNSFLVNIGYLNTYSGANNVALSSSNGVFKTAFGGHYYLADNSPYRNVGTTNIHAGLAMDLSRKTTYVPIEITNDINENATWYPQAGRDTDIPDIGYHYDPLDYIISGKNMYNATLIWTNGVAVGVYGANGLHFLSGAVLCSEGTPNNLNRLVRLEAVQEQTYVSGTPVSLMQVAQNGVPLPSVYFRFTDISQLADSAARNHILNFNNYFCVNPLAITDCQVRGGRFYSLPYNYNANGMTLRLTNTLFEHVNSSFTKGYSGSSTPLNIYAYNNLFIGSGLSIQNYSTNGIGSFYDNIFDGIIISVVGNGLANDYNAYINIPYRLGGGSSNVVGNEVLYARGPFGDYYQSMPILGPFGTYDTNAIDLQNRGSRTASAAGLYHYTTQTTQTKEGSGPVDIGLHYVACGPSYEAYTGFSSISNGANEWSYCYSTTPLGSTIAPLTAYGRCYGWYGAGDFWSLVMSYYQHPGENQNDSVRRFTVPYSGKISLRSVVDADTITPTDGVRVGIFLNGQPLLNWMRVLPGLNHYQVNFNLAVKAGDTLDFQVNRYNEIDSDGTVWNPTITYVGECDADGDGLPDYLEDRNGDGIANSGETDWNSISDPGLKVKITQPHN